jgi:hypothetical protein
MRSALCFLGCPGKVWNGKDLFAVEDTLAGSLMDTRYLSSNMVKAIRLWALEYTHAIVRS